MRWFKGLMRLIGSIRLIGSMSFMTLITLMGCSGDSVEPEPVQPSLETPIAFAGAMQDEQTVTRSTGLEENLPADGKLFTVFGYKNTGMEGTDNYTAYQTVFPGYTVKWTENTAATTTTNSHDWEYVGQEFLGQDEQTVKYWDWSAKAYRFFGITKTYDKLDGKVVEGNYNLTFSVDLTSTTGIAAVPYYSRLWFSNNSYDDYPTRPYGSAVELEFLKPICQVRIMFVYEDPEDNRVNTPLTDISFYPSGSASNNTVKQKGKVTISYPLTGTGKTENCAFDAEAQGTTISRDYREDEKSTTDKNEEDHYWYTVLPITDQGPFTLEVCVDGDPKTTVVPEEYMNWQPGYKYTYIFKVHVDGSVSIGAVQSAFTGWTIQGPYEYPVYNW